MQDTVVLPTVNENITDNARIEETDYEIQSKASTPKLEKQQSQSQLPHLRSDFVNNNKKTQRNPKSRKYVPPVTDREGWWRVTIKDTPNPGTYDTHLNTFIKEVLARPMTYGFKSDGRRRDPQPLEPKGKELLPGAYSVEDFVERMNQLRLSYGFKGPDRQDVLKKSLNFNQDKDIDVPPGLYETQKYHTIDGAIESTRHSFFKSKTTRKIFLPKLGPAPGEYEPKTQIVNEHSPHITSAFLSGTDRFQTRGSKVPGPGTYDLLTTSLTAKQINQLSMRGVFLNANYTHPTSSAI